MLSSVRYLSTLLASNTQRQTIYALSTPPGKGGVAIVRVSGPDAKIVWDNMVRSCKPNKPIKDPVPWKLHRCHIVHPKNKSLIDDGLAVYFQGNNMHRPPFSKINTTTAPHSYTTYPTVELHIHSGRAFISAVLSSLSALSILRPSDSGEFKRQSSLKRPTSSNPGRGLA